MLQKRLLSTHRFCTPKPPAVMQKSAVVSGSAVVSKPRIMPLSGAGQKGTFHGTKGNKIVAVDGDGDGDIEDR